MGRQGQKRVKTTAAVIKARKRKVRNRELREQQLKTEAAGLGITVTQLITNKALEIKRVTTDRVYRSRLT